MEVTREALIEEIRRVARELGKDRVSLSEFRLNSKISDWYIWKLFDSWNEATKEAGLLPHEEKKKIDNKDLFSEMERVFLVCGGICNRTRFDRLSKYSVDVYKKRFGRWDSVLTTFRSWLLESNRDFPHINQLPLTHKKPDNSSETMGTEKPQRITSWEAIGNTTYGSFLNFRGLQHSPLNEQGVVFLFGMICFELGFVVEAIRNEYPDCEAKRCIDRRRDEWERVRIEFEYRSSNFKEHCHDPKRCDVIVCWIHDWKECPLEVVELKSVLEKLSD
jgi:hypothetical protein